MNIGKTKSRLLSCLILCGLLFGVYGQEMEPTRENVAQSGIAEKMAEAIAVAAETTAVGKETVMPELSETDDADDILALLIEDEGFRECVRYDADILDGDSREKVLQKLEECESLVLEGDEREIYSLEALVLLPNLKQLMVDIDQQISEITDFTPIAQLSRLERLYINSGTDEPVDLSFLGGMHTITELLLVRCKITDFSFVEKMPQLQELGMQRCGVGDIGFLSGLTTLRALYLDGNSVTDLTPLAGLDKLECLHVSENRIQDISALGEMEELFDLAAYRNEIRDISVLARLPRLNKVEISDNRIEDLSPLADKEELMYAAVFGNPVKSLMPVLEVPMLIFTYSGVSEEEETFIADWLAEYYPEAEEFTCVDFIRGDLNNDGRQDIAFVADSDAFDVYEGEDFPERMPQDRRMFVLLQEEDGSWTQLEDAPPLGGSMEGGMRGGPYDRAFMEAGYLQIVQGWGSSGGTTEREIYEYRDGSFHLIKKISLDDYNYAYGYDVLIEDEQTGFWQRYAYALDDGRIVRVDLTDADHLVHKAYPGVSIYDGSHYIYHTKMELQTTPEAALDRVCEMTAEEGDVAVRENLPYAEWQKEGYELLLGVTLPDYYYALSEPKGKKEWTGDSFLYDESTGNYKWMGDYLYYEGMKIEDEKLYHVINLERYKKSREILVEDATGEIKEE